MHLTFDPVPSHCFIVDRGWCDNDLARYNSTCLEYLGLEKKTDTWVSSAIQNMPSTNYMVDKSSQVENSHCPIPIAHAMQKKLYRQ